MATGLDPAGWPEEGLMRLLAAVEDPLGFEAKEAWQHMNEVLDAYKAGTAAYEEYTAAFAEFERVAKVEREAQP